MGVSGSVAWISASCSGVGELTITRPACIRNTVEDSALGRLRITSFCWRKTTTSVANGVMYTTDTKGNLAILDAASGATVQRPMSLDTGDVCSGQGGGVARSALAGEVDESK